MNTKYHADITMTCDLLTAIQLQVDWLISESNELVSWMKGHDSTVHCISIHASGRYALTSSNTVAQMWDLDTFSRKRTLNGAQTVGIQQVYGNF